MHVRFTAFAFALAALVTAAGFAAAQAQKADPRDAAAVESCLKERQAANERALRCIGVVADPCTATREGETTAGAVTCFNRERLVWDDLLGRAFDELRVRLETPQWTRLRESQRIWTEARKQACEFYWDFFRGTLAGPSSEECYMRETAQRAVYLRFFLDLVKK